MRRVKGGVANRVAKKTLHPGKVPGKWVKLAELLETCGEFSVYLFDVFQGRFLIDLLTALGLIFDGLLDVFSIIFGPFSRTPEPLIFDNSPMR